MVVIKGIDHQWKKECGGQTGSGNDLRCHKHKTEKQGQNQKYQGVNEENGDGTDDYALAAFKIKIKGENMTDHAEKTCHILTGTAQQNITDDNGNQRFEYISHQRQKACGFAEGAKHIGHACIARTVVAHVIAVDLFGDNDGGIDASQQIRGKSNGKEKQNGKAQYLYSCFSIHKKAVFGNGRIKEISHASSFVLSRITN